MQAGEQTNMQVHRQADRYVGRNNYVALLTYKINKDYDILLLKCNENYYQLSIDIIF